MNDEGRKDSDAKSDPIDNDYSGLDESWRNTTPDFYRPDDTEKKSRAEKRAEKNSSGKSRARVIEEAASANNAAGTGRSSLMNGGEAEARGVERSGFYSGSGADSRSAGKNKGSLKGRLKGKGPFFLVGAIISLAMILVASSQVMAPFAFVANALDELNSLRTSMRVRGNYLTRFQMKSDRHVSLTQGGVFSSEKFKVSKSTQKKLAKHNITYSEDGGVRHLIYKNDITGESFKVVANEGDLGKVSGSIVLDDALASSDDFYRDHDLSTRNLKGHFAGWFDSVSQKFHRRIVNIRNRLAGVDEQASDEEIQTAAKKTGLEGDQFSESNSDQPDQLIEESDTVKWEQVETGRDADDNPIYEWKTVERVTEKGIGGDGVRKNEIVDDTGKLKGSATSTVTNAMSARAKKVLAAGGALTSASQMVCGFMKTVGAISAVATAIQRANILNYVTVSLEAIQKTQVDDSAGNTIHYFMNGLSEKGETTGIDEAGKMTTAKTDTAAMESPAFNHFFGGSPVAADDPVARKFNVDNTFSAMLSMNVKASNSGQDGDESLNNTLKGDILHVLFPFAFKGNQYEKTGTTINEFIPQLNDLLSASNGNKLGNYKKCLMMRGAEAMTQMAGDILTLVTTGPGAFFKKFLDSFIQLAITTMIMTAVSMVIAAVIPRLVEWLAKDLITNMAGEDAAYALDAGANMYLGEQEQSSSGKPGTEAEVVAMHNATQAIIAEEARYDRLTRSPFDVTSKNTFLGSIVYSLVPIGLSLYSTPTTLVSRAASVAGQALTSVLPVVSAADDGVKFRRELKTDCPSLSEFGLAGDAYCSPYYVSNYATDDALLKKDPYDIFKEICADNFENGCDMEAGGETDKEDADGVKYGYNPKIKKDSELGKWVIACSARTTPFGYVDGNEYQLFGTGNEAFDTVLNTGTGMIPIAGDFVDFSSAAVDETNIKWSSGEACLSDESKYYSAYSEDQRWMENAGIVEDSAIAVYLDDWYKEHPLDNSTEGIIARYSGMTKDQVNETLGVVEALDYIAHYDPAGLGPKTDAPEIEEKWQYEDGSIVAEVLPLVKAEQYIIYDDLRRQDLTA